MYSLPACLPACLYIPDTRMQISFINILCFVGTLTLMEGIPFTPATLKSELAVATALAVMLSVKVQDGFGQMKSGHHGS